MTTRRDITIETWPLLTPAIERREAYRRHLLGLPAHEVIGQRGDGKRCPLGRYYRAWVSLKDGGVVAPSYSAYLLDRDVRRMDHWERAFIERIDAGGSWLSNVTAAEALAALGG